MWRSGGRKEEFSLFWGGSGGRCYHSLFGDGWFREVLWFFNKILRFFDRKLRLLGHVLRFFEYMLFNALRSCPLLVGLSIPRPRAGTISWWIGVVFKGSVMVARWIGERVVDIIGELLGGIMVHPRKHVLNSLLGRVAFLRKILGLLVVGSRGIWRWRGEGKIAERPWGVVFFRGLHEGT